MAKVCKLHGDKPQESSNNVLWTDKIDIMHSGRFGENQTKNINSNASYRVLFVQIIHLIYSKQYHHSMKTR